MIKYNLKELNIQVVDKIVSNTTEKDIYLVFENTKGLDPNIINQIKIKYPNINYSIQGGLNPKKQKYATEHYQKRTYYSPDELSRIIEIFQKIERKIEINWTETEKAMFVYETLCNNMIYEEVFFMARDCSRNLLGLIHHKAVCSGFAIILKEAMDRLGFENVYQNRESSHSWNVVKLDGKYRSLELTWDTYRKTNNCEFLYFNQDPEFYKNKHHNLELESEEHEYPIVPYSFEELKIAYKNIQKRKFKAQKLITTDSKTYTLEKDLQSEGKEFNFVVTGNDIQVVVKSGRPPMKKFVRNDGSTFYLIPIKNNIDNINSYVYVSNIGNDYLELNKIHTETKLESLDSSFDNIIANDLLRKERISLKLQNFNGYVGFIGNNKIIYYNKEFEKNNLNIYR